MTPEADDHAMRLALDQAQNAWLVGEVPVGAVVMRAGRVVATGYNRPITTHDPTAHAEIVALRHAAELLQNYRLPECELFVTLEPCAMCAMAMLHARLKRVVYGAPDAKTGAAGSVLNVFDEPLLNHQTSLAGGVLAPLSAELLRAFFAERRAQRRAERGDAGGTAPVPVPLSMPAEMPRSVQIPAPVQPSVPIPAGEATELLADAVTLVHLDLPPPPR